MSDLEQLGNVDVETGKAIVCLVSEEIRYKVGVAASVFTTLAAANVNIHMISQGASEINIGVVIEESDLPVAIKDLHARFFEQHHQRAERGWRIHGGGAERRFAGEPT